MSIYIIEAVGVKILHITVTFLEKKRREEKSIKLNFSFLIGRNREKMKNVFISHRFSGIYGFLGQDTLCTCRHCTTGSKNSLCMDASLGS